MTPLIQRTMNAISVTNEYLFDIASEIEAKEQFASDIEMEIIYVTDENVCFSFASEKKIYRYIYTPDDKGELTFKEVKEESINPFYFVDTKIIAKEPIATDNENADTNISSEEEHYAIDIDYSESAIHSEEEHANSNESIPSTSESIKNDFADKKPRWDLLPIEELAGVVDVYTAGAKKYGENRWQYLPNGVNRYMGAFFRHLTAYKRGEQFDPEDGCLHLDKCIWNMIAVRHCFLADKGINPNTSDYSELTNK